jgi:galactokinase/mevalonate kinase-like predicted kinase
MIITRTPLRISFFGEGTDYPVEIHHIADLPARTGLGTSSAFTVGLLLGL